MGRTHGRRHRPAEDGSKDNSGHHGGAPDEESWGTISVRVHLYRIPKHVSGCQAPKSDSQRLNPGRWGGTAHDTAGMRPSIISTAISMTVENRMGNRNLRRRRPTLSVIRHVQLFPVVVFWDVSRIAPSGQIERHISEMRIMRNLMIVLIRSFLPRSRGPPTHWTSMPSIAKGKQCW